MRAGVFAVASIFGAIGFIGAATAAPQVLMVVTPSDEMPLTCENGICSTEVAAICLQPDRSNPQRGKSYSVRASDAKIQGARSSRVEDTMTLIGRTAAGQEMVLPAAKLLNVNAEREHYAVTLSVDEAVMRQHGLTSLAVRVTGNVLLFPDADQDDPNPQTPSDLQIAETTQRGTAERVLSKHNDELTGARMVRYAINALPRDRASSETEREAARNAAMQQPASADAVAYVKDAFFACRSVTDHAVIKRYDSRYSYRACLGVMHDEIIDGVNKKYWDALKAGS
ncbi:MAG: hypothetical protein OXT06_09935 [Rhodospirillaceae bacterium]|nr:hypothetical protein [Rhodospirillaceae bacterium]MDD9916184.1 hypothetical protein [Rhodospirillaceae bacterium]